MVFKRTNDRLSVFLSFKETRKWGIESKVFKKGFDESLSTLLRRAMFETGCFPDTRKFKVQINKKGRGTVITFSPLYRTENPFEPIIFKFSDLENLYSAAEKIEERYRLRIIKSDLYFYCGYVLIIYPLVCLGADFFHTMNEYAEFGGRSYIKAAFFEEHARLLQRGRAIEKLCL